MNKVEEYIVDLPAEIGEIVFRLREIILSFSPEIKEKISYRIPFFYINKSICYLNPLMRKRGVDFAFIRGIDFSNYQDILEARGRKKIKSIVVETTNDIDEKLILELIEEAILLDRK